MNEYHMLTLEQATLVVTPHFALTKHLKSNPMLFSNLLDCPLYD